jgi:hypothetical protein
MIKIGELVHKYKDISTDDSKLQPTSRIKCKMEGRRIKGGKGVRRQESKERTEVFINVKI